MIPPSNKASNPTSAAATRVDPAPGSTATSQVRRALVACFLATAVALLNAGLWWALNPPLAAPDAPERVNGLAYNAFQRWDGPLAQRFPSMPDVAQDLQQLAPRTGQLRTYSAAEFPQLPAMAAQAGLQLTLGLWLDQRKANNELEVQAAVDATRRPGPIQRLIVGNETLLHGKLTLAELTAYLQRVKQLTGLPVSTAEPWHMWLLQPRLAEHVDFITVHLLPYWEGVAVEDAVEDALARYEQVRQRFPGKTVVIGEVGWPSAGNPVKRAQASPAAQAVFVRQFVARAEAMKLDYFLMEAVDQPWKQATEGTVGAHWGLLDAQRQPKFAFTGTVLADPYWRVKAGAAAALGLLAMLPFLWHFAHMRLAGRVAFALMAQAVASFAVLLFTRPLEHYLRLTDWLMLAVLLPALVLMAAMLLAQCFEFAELFWRRSLRRRARLKPWLPDQAATKALAADVDADVNADTDTATDTATGAPPLISIHLACSNEPPEAVILAIDSLVALQWPQLEILVVDNNTTDPQKWQPLQAHVEKLWAQGIAQRTPTDGTSVDTTGLLGHNDAAETAPVDAAIEPRPRLRFFHLPKWPGFKAGALNYALQQTDPQAQWVAVVDADYVVKPQWLQQLAGWMQAREVGIIQAPQAHRHWQGSRLARMMNWEYEGFFRIGMHHRHERDAIIQHGTMTLIRRSAMQQAGGWDEACICEDTELGLRVLMRGWRAVYVDEVMGAGLVPADFGAYRRQRQRWAQGGMQILRRHVGALFAPPFTGGTPATATAKAKVTATAARTTANATGTGTGTATATATATAALPQAPRSGLRLGQRYHFLAGWLPWMGDALHLLFSVLVLLWSLGFLLAPQYFGLPLWLFVVPLAVFFTARALLGPLLYRRRVPCNWADTLGAALAGMGLSHSVAQGVLAGLTAQPAQFHVTQRVGLPVDSDRAEQARAMARPAANPAAHPAAHPVESPLAHKAAHHPAPGAQTRTPWWAVVREEAALLIGLWVCIVALASQRTPDDVALLVWVGLLGVQSLPYAAALICAWLSPRQTVAEVRPSAMPRSVASGHGAAGD